MAEGHCRSYGKRAVIQDTNIVDNPSGTKWALNPSRLYVTKYLCV